MKLVNYEAFLIDLDGVLYVGGEPIDGAKETIDFLRENDYKFKFVSNSTQKRRKTISEKLNNWNFKISKGDIFTPPLAAVNHMKKADKNRCFLLSTDDIRTDFEENGIVITGEDADYVVIGDAGENFTYDLLNRAFRVVLSGAKIIALEKDKYWRSSKGLLLSAGPFVAALEYATGEEATIVGKPAKDFFMSALQDMKAEPVGTAMIGDDINTDIGGAKKCGLQGILVKTGKYREELVRKSNVKPDLLIDSIAKLPEYL